MPGIVGIITSMPADRARKELDRMIASMRHEPSLESGTWVDEALGVYVGWIARPRSFASGMPLLDEAHGRILIFSGEEYSEHPDNHKGAPYLLHAYENSATFPASLNGIFHGLAVDRRRGDVTLFNDRYGMHRLYFHEAKDGFYFAAAAKAILVVRPELRTIDPRGLGEFVSCGCVLENRSLFKDIYVLPGGSAWRFRNKALHDRQVYFRVREWEEQPALAFEDYYRELRDVFSRSLPRYFNGAEPVGIALTGGLDTRLLMAWRKAEPNTLPCYTFGSMYRENQDVRVAKNIAALCKQSHSVISIDRSFLSQFHSYAERTVYLTDGTVDVSRTADLYVSEQARTIAPVKVVGTYGSEMLTDAPAFKPIDLLPGLFAPVTKFIQDARTTYNVAHSGHPVSFAAFRQSPWWHYGVLRLEETQLTVRAPYLDNDVVRTMYRAPPGAHRDVRLRLIRDGSPVLGAVPTDRGLGGSALARRLQEFTLRGEYAYDYAMPQWLARIDRFLAPAHVERLFLGRHKPSHYRLWYRDVLSRYVRDILLDRTAQNRPYLDRSALQSVVQRHISGSGNYTREIHKLLTLELTHRQFIDQLA